MEFHTIKYDNKEIVLQEPTLQQWQELMLYKDLEEEDDFVYTLISIMTKISRDELREVPYSSVRKVADSLSAYMVGLDNSFHKDFEFKGVKYSFIDMSNLKFGEFVDIDNYLQKPASIRNRELNKMMAFYYREVIDGKLVKYDASKVEGRAEIFKELPVKYFHGAMRFFFHLGNISQRNTQFYLEMEQNFRTMTGVKKHLLLTGVGIYRLLNWLTMTSQKYLKWLKFRCSKLLTYLPTRLT
jgi:hypothetical protein